MSRLREAVMVKTPTSTLHGELFIGHNGLPEMHLLEPWGSEHQGPYSPTTLPHTWTVVSIDMLPGDLLDAWGRIEAIQTHLWECERDAEREIQREAEEETHRESDNEDEE